jgi:hypothetical protein
MKKAFFDSSTRLLKTHGYIESNEPDDLVLEVPDTFNATIGRVKLNAAGDGMEPYTPPPLTETQKDAEAQIHLDSQKLIKAVALWIADALNIPPAQAKQAILTKYRNL